MLKYIRYSTGIPWATAEEVFHNMLFSCGRSSAPPASTSFRTVYFRIRGLSSEFRVQGLGFTGFKVYGSGLGFRVSGAQHLSQCPVLICVHLPSVITQRVHVAIWYILGPQSRYTGNSLGPKYIQSSYMDPSDKKRQEEDYDGTLPSGESFSYIPEP